MDSLERHTSRFSRLRSLHMPRRHDATEAAWTKNPREPGHYLGGAQRGLQGSPFEPDSKTVFDHVRSSASCAGAASLPCGCKHRFTRVGDALGDAVGRGDGRGGTGRLGRHPGTGRRARSRPCVVQRRRRLPAPARRLRRASSLEVNNSASDTNRTLDTLRVLIEARVPGVCGGAGSVRRPPSRACSGWSPLRMSYC